MKTYANGARVPGPAQLVGYVRGTIDYTVAGAGTNGNSTIGIIPSGAVVVDAIVVVNTAFNANTTNVVIVGDAGDPDRYVAAADVTEGTPGGYRGTTATGIGYTTTTDTTVIANYAETGTAATTGSATVTILFIAPGNQGS